MKKQYFFTLDYKLASSIDLPNIVSGDTGNEFVITIENGGDPVDLTNARVRFIIVNKDGPSSQDTDVEGNDIDMTQAESGVLTIAVHADMISNGLNAGFVETYTGENREVQNTTQNFNFTAKLSPSEKAAMFPSLIRAEAEYRFIIKELQEVVAAARAVLESGDNVRYTEQINSDERKAVARSNIAAASNNHSHGIVTYDGKVLNHPGCLLETDENENIAACRRIIAGDADPSSVSGLHENDIYLHSTPLAGNRNVHLVVPYGGTWSDNERQAYSSDDSDTLMAIAEHAALITQIVSPDNEVVTLYEFSRCYNNNNIDTVLFKSIGTFYHSQITCELTFGGPIPQMLFWYQSSSPIENLITVNATWDNSTHELTYASIDKTAQELRDLWGKPCTAITYINFPENGRYERFMLQLVAFYRNEYNKIGMEFQVIGITGWGIRDVELLIEVQNAEISIEGSYSLEV